METRPIQVRDLSAVVEMGRRFQETSNFADCGFNEAKFAGMLLTAAEKKGPVLALVAEHDGEIIGFFVATASRYFFSDAITAEDNAVYIAPEHRQHTREVLPRWIGTFEAWAQAMGAMSITIGCDSGTEGEKFIAKMIERGYRKTGVYTTKRI